MKLGAFFRPGGLASLVVAAIVAVGGVAAGITREVPVGSVKGRATMEENNVGLPNAEVVLTPKSVTSPQDGVDERGSQVERQDSFSTRTEKDGSFVVRGLPAGVYDVGVYGKFHSLKESHILLVEEGKTSDVAYTTVATKEDLRLDGGSRVFTPAETPKFQVSGLARGNSVGIKVYRLEPELMADRNMLYTTFSAFRDQKQPFDPGKLKDKITLVKQDSIDISKRDIEGYFQKGFKTASLPEGQFLVVATVDQSSRAALVNITHISLVTKSDGKRLLGLLTDITTGQPIPGIAIETLDQKGTQRLGVTGADGLAAMDFPKAGSDSGSKGSMVMARVGDAVAVCSIEGGVHGGEAANAWMQTDRPVYRPGDTVQFRVVARSTQGLPATPLAGKPVAVAMRSGDDEEADGDSGDEPTGKAVKGVLDRHGIFSGRLTIPPDTNPGYVSFEIDVDGKSTTHSVPLLAYRKADYKVTVTPTVPTVYRGDKAEFTVQATSYTGEPVVGAKVTGSIYRRQDWTPQDVGVDSDESDDPSDEADYSGDYLAHLEGVTDGAGRCTLSVQTGKEKGDYADVSDAVYTLKADVAGGGDRYFSGSGQLKVVRGDFDLTSQFDRNFINPGEEAKLSIRARSNVDKLPVSGDVTVKISRTVYQAGKETLVAPALVNLKMADGSLDYTFKAAQQGDYLAEVSMTDSHGRKLKSEDYVWVPGEREPSQDSTPTVDLKLDKKNYQPGDTAQGIIETSAPGGTALLLIEGEGISAFETVKLEAKQTRFSLASLNLAQPVAHVSVTYVAKKTFMTVSKRMKVGLDDRKLAVKVTPSTLKAHPGDQVGFRVETKDNLGRPVSAAVALSVVDEAIYAVREDNNDPLDAFYPAKYSNVRTSYSFEEVYLDAEDKSPVNVQVRKNFADTAAWLPTVETGEDGRANVSVKLPDNLTEWRATAVAVTDDTQVGRGKSSVVAAKDLMARLSLPAVAVADDVQRVTASLVNSTDHPMDVVVTTTARGATLDPPADQTVHLDANKSVNLTYNMTVTTPGVASVKLVAVAGTASDGLERTVPVIVHGPKLSFFAAGEASPGKPGTCSIDLAGPPNGGQATITVAASVTGALLNAIPSLVEDEYECTEQTMDRLVPVTLAAHALPASNFAKLKDGARRKSLRRLPALVHPDGGFGWWEYDASNPFMTAFFLEGARRLADVGEPLPKNYVDGAVKWAQQQLAHAPVEGEYGHADHLRLACAVLLWGDDANAVGVVKKELSQTNEVSALARIALTFHYRYGKTKGQDDLTLAQDAYARMMGFAKESGTGITFDGPSWIGESESALEAVAVIDADPAKASKMLEGILLKRRGPAWRNTYDTAGVVFGGLATIARNKEGSAAGTIHVACGKGHWDHTFTPGDVTGRWQVQVPAAEFSQGKNPVSITADSVTLYYGVAFTSRIEDKAPAEVVGQSGLKLKREYFHVEARPLENGLLSLTTAKTPSLTFKSGEVFRCRLTVTPPSGTRYVMLEDPVPSNCRVVEIDDPDRQDWQNWWAQSIFRDDRATFFFDTDGWDAGMWRRPQVIEYAIRAEAVGKGIALPAEVSEMYRPDVRARTGQDVLEVTQ